VPIPEPPQSQTDSSHGEILHQLLSEQPAEGYRLPALAPTENWFEKFLDEIADYIEHLFPRGNSLSSLTGETLLEILRALALTSLIVALAYFAWRIWKIYAPRRAVAVVREALPSTSASITRELELAVKQGEWALAARLRWRLFLFRIRKPLSLTPLELLPRSERMVIPVMSVYATMFGAAGASAEYQELDSALQQAEQEGGI